ncbi:coiled-coil domain-containing protein 150 isoform X2 [Triplophysa dalaica]|nr:coiled-coil domain-containing protein 150 isoform X2 [Triplophysa dalaica]XP_056613096.1 coiled-coil domain-containing protein 150 isoform X2 [Triplophysa dalaica]
MSRSVGCPLNMGATALESLSSLQRRLQSAEEQSEELARGLNILGVSADHLLLNSSASSSLKHPVSPVNIHQGLGADGEGLLWRLCETLVSRVCRLESLLQALKLATFRLETDRELNPSHSAHLHQELSILQGQYEEEQRSSRREVLKLQDRLQQACDERKEAQQEVFRLREALHSTVSAKRRELIAQETAVDLKAKQSHNALLLRVKELERVIERKSGQVKALEAARHTLHADRQVNRAELKTRTEHIFSLERECQQIKDQSDVKETLISELSKEMKNLKMSLQKREQENVRLMRDERDLRAAAADVQVLNNKLEVQCSKLKATVQSLTLENTRIQNERQNNIKEQMQLLDTVRRNGQTELQSTISEKLALQKQLEVLKADQARLQQSSLVAQQTAVNHQQMLEQTIERLQEELSCALRKEENTRKERDQINSEMSSKIILLENEKNSLETQLAEIKIEFSTVNSGLQKQEKENKALMESLTVMQHQQETHRQVEQMLWDMTDSKNKLAYEKGKLQAKVQQMGEDLKTMKAECSQYCQINITLQNSYTQVQSENNTLKEHLHMLQQQHRDTNEVVQVLEKVLSSHTLLQQNTQTLQTELQDRTQELHTLRKEKLQAMKEIQKLRAEAEHLEKLTRITGNKVESLEKALDEAQFDNRKLAQNLEQLLQENHNAQEKLNTLRPREVELKDARDKICRLTEHLDSFKKLLKRKKDSKRQLKKALDEASLKSHDLSQANQELREKVSDLEKLVSCLKSHLNSRTPENSSLRIKDLEAEIESLEEIKDDYKKRSYEQSQSFQQLHSEMASLQTELQFLASNQGEQGELQAERELNHTLHEKCLHLEKKLKQLQDERDQAEVSHGEITENTIEDHRDLCSISESFKDESVPQKLTENFWRTEKDCTTSAAAQNRSETDTCVFDTELEPWDFTLQRWEIKKDQTRITSSYKPTRHVHTLT